MPLTIWPLADLSMFSLVKTFVSMGNHSLEKLIHSTGPGYVLTGEMFAPSMNTAFGPFFQRRM